MPSKEFVKNTQSVQYQTYFAQVSGWLNSNKNLNSELFSSIYKVDATYIRKL